MKYIYVLTNTTDMNSTNQYVTSSLKDMNRFLNEFMKATGETWKEHEITEEDREQRCFVIKHMGRLSSYNGHHLCVERWAASPLDKEA